MLERNFHKKGITNPKNSIKMKGNKNAAKEYRIVSPNGETFIIKNLTKYSETLGEKTNNEAEYEAVIFALKKFKLLFGKKLAESSEIEIRTDSEFLIKQLNGQYKILDPKIQQLFLMTWNLKLDFKKVKFKFIFREQNKEADKLVNEALNSKRRLS